MKYALKFTVSEAIICFSSLGHTTVKYNSKVPEAPNSNSRRTKRSWGGWALSTARDGGHTHFHTGLIMVWTIIPDEICIKIHGVWGYCLFPSHLVMSRWNIAVKSQGRQTLTQGTPRGGWRGWSAEYSSNRNEIYIKIHGVWGYGLFPSHLVVSLWSIAEMLSPRGAKH